MKFPTKPPPPQGEGMPAHVNAKTSDRTGHLEDQNLDLDARTLAILGKRQRLSVRTLHHRAEAFPLL